MSVSFWHFSAPSSVRLFKVLSLAANHVTLLWEPVPLNNQGGVILFYQIGVNRQNTGTYQQCIL